MRLNRHDQPMIKRIKQYPLNIQIRGISSYDRFRVQFLSKQWLGLQNEIRAGHKRARVTEGEEVTIWTLWLTWNLGDQMEQVDTHTGRHTHTHTLPGLRCVCAVLWNPMVIVVLKQIWDQARKHKVGALSLRTTAPGLTVNFTESKWRLTPID